MSQVSLINQIRKTKLITTYRRCRHGNAITAHLLVALLIYMQDIYGAFQVCAIGILAAPVTVSQSKTYFNDPGRNTIFVWSTLILAGLVSCTIQFYRSVPIFCKHNDAGEPLSPNPKMFQYGHAKCGLVCNVKFPQSPR